MKPLKDYSFIKGFNHSLGWAKDYDHETADREMGYAQRLSLNSCRLFIPMQRWRENKKKFLEDLTDFVRTAWAKGISTTPILLMPYFADDQTPYWLAEDHSNAPIPGCYFKENWGLGEEYVADVVSALKDEPGLLFWDVMNEPSWHGFMLSVDNPEEKARRLEMVWEFVRHFVQFVREKDPVNALGVGHTFIEDTELSKTGDMVDIIIFHDYLETRSRVEATYKRAIELSEKYGKPIINNETGCLCRSNPYDMVIEIADKYKVGWYLFELMINEGMWSRVHGICYPDGTVRDPSIVAAIMGFFRNRGESALYPDVNQEGHADKALALARQTLDDHKSTVQQLLESAEYMANLLEAGELIPMALPPTAEVAAFRRARNPDLFRLRALVYRLSKTLQDACDIL